MKAIVARTEASLGARVVRRTSLLYMEGPDAKADRPEHVRAGSALSPLGEITNRVLYPDHAEVNGYTER